MEEQNNQETQKLLVTKLGSLLHNEWRKPRRKNDDTFEPDIEKTLDRNWIKKYGTDEVDIANTIYEELPEDWKGENKASAEVAMTEILKTIESGGELNESFIEMTSDVIHQGWLSRNERQASPEQNKPYAELSEQEKEKDKVIVRKAIEIYKASI